MIDLGKIGGICLDVFVVGLGLGELVDLGLKLLKKGYRIVLGNEKWFDELFNGYLVKESKWGFRVLIGKRKGLNLGL